MQFQGVTLLKFWPPPIIKSSLIAMRRVTYIIILLGILFKHTLLSYGDLGKMLNKIEVRLLLYILGGTLWVNYMFLNIMALIMASHNL